jgi:hypothetical protein
MASGLGVAIDDNDAGVGVRQELVSKGHSNRSCSNYNVVSNKLCFHHMTSSQFSENWHFLLFGSTLLLQLGCLGSCAIDVA